MYQLPSAILELSQFAPVVYIHIWYDSEWHVKQLAMHDYSIRYWL